MRTTEYYKAEELPDPEVLTMREMLDEMEEVNVLGKLDGTKLLVLFLTARHTHWPQLLL